MNKNLSYGDFAYIYDALTDDVEYEKRCDYIEKIFSLHLKSKPNLIADLACGTGTVCTIMSERGYDCIGIDSSDMMLDVAAEKNKDGRILYLNQDICEFELYGTVDCFLCMLDSINYLTCDGDLDALFSLVHNYLNPGGLFVFDVNTLFKYSQILSDNTFVYENNDIFYTWENCFDGMYCDFRLNFFVGENGIYHRFTEEHTQRFYSAEYIKSCLKKSGLVLRNIYGDMSFENPAENDERIFFVVQKCE